MKCAIGMDTGRGREREGEGGRKQFTMGICENPLPMEQLTMGTQWRSSLWEPNGAAHYGHL